MHIVIDDCESIANWEADEGITLSLNKFSSGILKGSGSLKMKFESGVSGKGIRRVFGTPFDLSDYSDIRFFVSQLHSDLDSNTGVVINLYYQGEKNLDLSYYVTLPAESGNRLVVSITSLCVALVDEIEILILGDEAGCLFFDNFIACLDEPVLDTLQAIESALQDQIIIDLGNLVEGVAEGADSVNLPDWRYVSKYSVLSFVDGDYVESHQVAGDVSTGNVGFTPMLEGVAFRRALPEGTRVCLMVFAAVQHDESILYVPGINISGIVPFVRPGHNGQIINNSFSISDAGDRGYRKEEQGHDYELMVNIDVRAMHPELMVRINSLLQGMFGFGASILVNNIYEDIDYVTDPVYDNGGVTGDDIPSTLHSFSVKFVPSSGVKRVDQKVGTFTLEVTPE